MFGAQPHLVLMTVHPGNSWGQHLVLMTVHPGNSGGQQTIVYNKVRISEQSALRMQVPVPVWRSSGDQTGFSLLFA